jgi:cytochrome c6
MLCFLEKFLFSDIISAGRARTGVLNRCDQTLRQGETRFMKKMILLFVLMLSISGIAGMALAEKASSKIPGEAKFKELCVMCHKDGGNIMNPKKTLHKKDLEANNIKTAADIVKTMRSPGPGMTKYNEKVISNKEATELAEYILKTFNK